MDKTQVDIVIRFLNSSWSSRPLDPTTALIWGGKLQEHDFDAVMSVLNGLVETSTWRPSLADILRPLRGAPPESSASAAFANVCEQINKRPRNVTAREAETVRRLGGWEVIGLWERDDWQWHRKAFAAIFDELATEARHTELRTPAAPLAEGRSQPALAHAPEAPPPERKRRGDEPMSYERIGEMAQRMAERFRPGGAS